MEIFVKYIVYMQFMFTSASLKITVSIEEWLVGSTFVK